MVLADDARVGVDAGGLGEGLQFLAIVGGGLLEEAAAVGQDRRPVLFAMEGAEQFSGIVGDGLDGLAGQGGLLPADFPRRARHHQHRQAVDEFQFGLPSKRPSWKGDFSAAGAAAEATAGTSSKTAISGDRIRTAIRIRRISLSQQGLPIAELYPISSNAARPIPVGWVERSEPHQLRFGHFLVGLAAS